MRMECLRCKRGSDVPPKMAPLGSPHRVTMDGCPECSTGIGREQWWDADGNEMIRKVARGMQGDRENHLQANLVRLK